LTSFKPINHFARSNGSADQKLVQLIPVVQRWGILGSKRSLSVVSVVPSITGKVRSVAAVVARDDVTKGTFNVAYNTSGHSAGSSEIEELENFA
jgi:hypothetical protein